jgi:hypothetical protein
MTPVNAGLCSRLYLLNLFNHSETAVNRLNGQTCPPPSLSRNSTIFWDITRWSPLEVIQHVGGTYRLHLQGRISRARYQRENRWQTAHENGSDMFLRNGGWLSTEHSTLHNHRCENLKFCKFKHLMLLKNGLSLSICVYTWIILNDFCLLPAPFIYVIVQVRQLSL